MITAMAKPSTVSSETVVTVKKSVLAMAGQKSTDETPGGQVTVHYVGVDYETGEQFDASWDRGEPIAFPLRGLIQGWQEGIPGMRVGGRRQLIIPPELAYGTSGGHRLSGRTLIFVIDLLDA